MKLFGKTERLPLPKLNYSPKIAEIKILIKPFLVRSNCITKHRHPTRVLEKCGKKAYVHFKHRLIQFTDKQAISRSNCKTLTTKDVPLPAKTLN